MMARVTHEPVLEFAHHRRMFITQGATSVVLDNPGCWLWVVLPGRDMETIFEVIGNVRLSNVPCLELLRAEATGPSFIYDLPWTVLPPLISDYVKQRRFVEILDMLT
jgi:hypothetical protein